MRVIAGSARGRRLQNFKDRRVMPTPDRVEEAVFSSIMPRLPDSNVLDLFAGSGALGIEALSRGAKSAVFVEKNSEVCGLIRANLAACGWSTSKEVRIVWKDAIKWLDAAGRPGSGESEGPEAWTYDVIFADPPYNKQYEEALLLSLSRADLLSPQGILVLESSVRLDLPERQGGLRLHQSKKYGDTKISYYMHEQYADIARD